MPPQDTANRRLSCNRCHAQKLRCPKSSAAGDGQSCMRCLNKGVECVYSAPQRKGRPGKRRSHESVLEFAAQIAPRGQTPATDHVDALVSGLELQQAPLDLMNLSTLNAGPTCRGYSPTEILLSEAPVSDLAEPMSKEMCVFGSAPGLAEWTFDPENEEAWPDLWATPEFRHPWSASPPSGGTVQLTPEESLPPLYSFEAVKHRDATQAARDTYGRMGSAQDLGVNSLSQSTAVPVGFDKPQSRAWDSPDNITVWSNNVAEVSQPNLHIERSFWAYLPGQKRIYKELTDISTQVLSPRLDRQSKVRDINIAKMLEQGAPCLAAQIPSKAVCDLLLYSFVVGVQPIHPLLDLAEFRQDYGAFWCAHKSKEDRHDPLATPVSSPSPSASPWPSSTDQSLNYSKNPGFIPLLLALLFSGAVAAPESYWSSDPALACLEADVMADQLHKSYLEALHRCEWTTRPNIQALTAALLGHSCHVKGNREALQNLSFMHTVVRLAQRMGLHRDNFDEPLSASERESRRRIWWHIVELDVWYSLRYGSLACCGTESTHWQVPLPGMGVEGQAGHDPSVLATLYARGRYEMVAFVHAFLDRVNSCGPPLGLSDLREYLDAHDQLRSRIKSLMNMMPAPGAPEQGFVPLRLANASMSTHEHLFTGTSMTTTTRRGSMSSNHSSGGSNVRGQPPAPSVFLAWARISLSMLSSASLLCLQRLLLGQPDLTAQKIDRLWADCSRLAGEVLRHLLHTVRVAAFAPYAWSLRSTSADVMFWQAILIVLTFLRHKGAEDDHDNNRSSNNNNSSNTDNNNNNHDHDRAGAEATRLARHLVDEAIEVLEPPSYAKNGWGVDSDTENTEVACVWRYLKDMRSWTGEEVVPGEQV
ncbi:hypothetical protein BD289DRAFT_443034 [Coniella lustricola]|uniref:Zn(2)-C6 fungal-type domain-containing protein n=1 Tax=Coniella lustricola TaxID=2025994 RepID=A0A2T2ZXK4_9PEZI|nr:hypothetical protein BD289DRAFT_443034 [Coniella lustricola]